MEQLDFQIMLTDNCYVKPNSMHLSFLMKIKQLSNEANDIESDLVTANNFFPHLMKEIGVTRYGNDKKPIQTFSPPNLSIFWCNVKTFAKKFSQKIEKTMFYSKKPIYFNKATLDRRPHNCSLAHDITDLSIKERITNFKISSKMNLSRKFPSAILQI